jgi:hypothetical protein
MSFERLVAQTTREAPSALTREKFVAPTLLPVCCICGLIRDETGSLTGLACWVTQGVYRKTHCVNPADFPLTHTYCPKCFTKIKITVRQYFRTIGTSR